ncbi:MAG TPA: GDSL-type esterase/lipase family protein [Burkholderiales bacterium]|nr:GDSL-type esterase/lipase family protein [Burkholderiales bacterium]
MRLFVPVREVGPLFTVVDPVLGKRIKSDFRAVRVTPEFEMKFTSNALGFRGPPFTGVPSQGLLFVGDSFTMGYGVNDGEEYPALIRARLDARYGAGRVPVINAGMGDNGNGRWIKLLRTELERFRPRLVVLQVMANDYDDNMREGLFRLSPEGRLQELPVKVSAARALEPWIDKVPGLSHSHLYGLLRQAIATQRNRGAAPSAPGASPPARDAERLTERLVEEALLLCKSRGHEVYVLLVGIEGERRDGLLAVLRAHAVQFADAPGKAQRPDLYYRIDGHWNRAGHEHVAELLYAKLEGLGTFRSLPPPVAEKRLP